MGLYDLLKGVRVLEVSFLAPDGLGGLLADLGAEVIKVEEPPKGSLIRWPGAPHWKTLSWRWNRGKKSVFLSLKTKAGRDAFIQLAAKCDVVIDGLRAGAVNRLGVDYEAVKVAKPDIVYCSISGFGQTGPYRDMPSHGFGFDVLAGLIKPVFAEDGTVRLPETSDLVGITAGPLQAGMAVLAALLKARATGIGQYIDVAEFDAALAWRYVDIDGLGNGVQRPVKAHRLRYQLYKTKDDQYVMFMALEDKFWKNFCGAVSRADIYAYPDDTPEQHEFLRKELTNIFLERTRADWVDLFIKHDIAATPVYLGLDALEDPQVKNRKLMFEQRQRDGSVLKLMGTPVKLPGQEFSPAPVPDAGQHTHEILSDLLSMDDATIAQLEQGRADGPASAA